MPLPLRRLLAAAVAVLVPASLLVLEARPAGAEAAYSPPVDGPVVDGFRPPPSPYGAGNRGIDLDAEPGDPVRASADGEVVWAGRIGLDHHVVVLHPDGIRTTYSFLRGVAVARGDPVRRGDVVGTAAGPVHFGARAGDRYVDPALLLEGGAPPEVRLVPHRRRRPGSEADERFALVRDLVGLARRGIDVGADAIRWMGEQSDAILRDAQAELEKWVDVTAALIHLLEAPAQAAEQLWRGLEYWRDQDGCTPGDVAPPPPPPGRRIAVLVGGFGSSSGHAAVLDVDTRALGYADDDVAQFSYAGGQAPGPRSISGLRTSTYDAGDTHGPIAESGVRLRELLQEIRMNNPGVPVDVIAHSMGGVVALQALEPGDDLDPRMPEIGTVVTLGAPHDGTDLATSGSILTQVGLTAEAAPLVVDDVAAVQDLSETSDFITEHRRRPIPEGVRVRSIAADGDLVVPANHSALPGRATNAVVDLGGVDQHGRLPGSVAGQREIALALAGMGPTCRNVWGSILGAASISFLEDVAGAVVTAPMVWNDNPFKPEPKEQGGSPPERRAR